MKSLECKICFTWEGDTRPFATIYDYEYLKNSLSLTNSSDSETYLERIKVDENFHQVVDIRVSILRDPNGEDNRYGIEMARAGEGGSYNTRIEVYLKKEKVSKNESNGGN